MRGIDGAAVEYSGPAQSLSAQPRAIDIKADLTVTLTLKVSCLDSVSVSNHIPLHSSTRLTLNLILNRLQFINQGLFPFWKAPQYLGCHIETWMKVYDEYYFQIIRFHNKSEK